MAPNTIARSAALAFLMLFAMASSSGANPLVKNMVFYMQDWITGANATAVAVAGLKNHTVTDFGTIMVIDDALTEGVARNSTQVGRARGIYVNSALDGFNFHLSLSLVFTNKAYNGSTLEIQGADRYTLKEREVAVVSGTGQFRFVRGYAVLSTAFLCGVNAVIQFNVTFVTAGWAWKGLN